MKIETSPVLTRKFLSELDFRVFTADDYYGFSGVQSPVPLIAETEIEVFNNKFPAIVIIDGDLAELVVDFGDGNFESAEIVEKIRELV